MMYRKKKARESFDHYHTRQRSAGKEVWLPSYVQTIGSSCTRNCLGLAAIPFQPAVYHVLTDRFISDLRLIVTINDTVTRDCYRRKQSLHWMVLSRSSGPGSRRSGLGMRPLVAGVYSGFLKGGGEEPALSAVSEASCGGGGGAAPGFVLNYALNQYDIK